jgi:hypothetical protein
MGVAIVCLPLPEGRESPRLESTRSACRALLFVGMQVLRIRGGYSFGNGMACCHASRRRPSRAPDLPATQPLHCDVSQRPMARPNASLRCAAPYRAEDPDQ